MKDAEWIATSLHLIKGSYVPEDLIQQLRQYDRRISDLNAECVRKLGDGAIELFVGEELAIPQGCIYILIGELDMIFNQCLVFGLA